MRIPLPDLSQVLSSHPNIGTPCAIANCVHRIQVKTDGHPAAEEKTQFVLIKVLLSATNVTLPDFDNFENTSELV